MKTKLPFIAVVVILVSACTTGTQMTKSYDDDIYFSPGDVAPVAVAATKAPNDQKSSQQPKSQQVVISQTTENADGSKAVTNSVYQTESENSDLLGYDPNEQELLGSDTTVYYDDDDVKYVINNYYDDNDMGYADQFNRFYGSYYYNPYYYDDFYYGYGGWGYPYWGFSVGIGWGYPYYGWGYPYYGYGWGYPYYGYGCGYPYYGYGDCYPGGGYYYDNVQVSQRRTTNMNAAGDGLNNTNTGRQSSLNSMNSSIQQGVNAATGNNQNTWEENGHTRGRTIDATGANQDVKNATVVNDRRGSSNAKTNTGAAASQIQGRNSSRTQMARPSSTGAESTRRAYQPSTTGSTYSQSRTARQSQNYTPSYNKPRIVNQSNYNNSYARPRTSNGNVLERAAVKSANSGNSGSTYSQPRSSSSMRQTYRSSSSYSSGSSSSSGRSSSNYSPPSSGSSPSYSTPSRSSSGSSYSGGSSSGGGGGYSGGSSGGGGGGGSGHRR